jgi:glutamate 2,3-aminomutase
MTQKEVVMKDSLDIRASLRSAELTKQIEDYLDFKHQASISSKRDEQTFRQKASLLRHFQATEADWENPRWQLKHRLCTAEQLSVFLHPSPVEFETWKQCESIFRFAVSPYYMSLIDWDDPLDPLRLQAVPMEKELTDCSHPLDPMNEEAMNPAGCITRRYPDRLILNVTNECAMYCRHCQRRRNIGLVDKTASEEVIQASIDYVKDHPEIRDVLVTGGDPLTMNDAWIESILKRLRAIPSVEIIRIGTRTPVTLPMRITDKLCKTIAKYHPVYVNTQFNHPHEITTDAALACKRMADRGIVLGNQSVLLNGVNNDSLTMRLLNQRLLSIRVRPYYLFHAKTVRGTTHFQTSVDDGLKIMKALRGFTSGLAIPSFIVNAPGGLGKIPLLPEAIVNRSGDVLYLKTWEDNIVAIDNKATIPFDRFKHEQS